MLIWAHGLAGSPRGRKVTALQEAGLEVLAPDFAGLDLAARVALLARLTAGPSGGDPGAGADRLRPDARDSASRRPEKGRNRRPVLAGSSYGGLAAALVAARHPHRFRGLLLLAPALDLDEPPNDDPGRLVAPPGVPTIILHGRDDLVVPVAGSRAYAARSGGRAELREVDDDHMLHGSIPLLIAAARELGA